jgi:hypothetical protein
MGILNYLPTFKVVEVNRSTALISGHMLAQYQADLSEITKKTVGSTLFVENGLIVGLGSDLKIANFNKSVHSQPFIVFTEELNTVVNGLKYFANEVVDGEVYPRSLALYVGDTYTTNNYSGTLSASTKFAKVVDGVITLQTAADADTLFAVEVSILPTGEAAARVTYMGVKNTIQEALSAAQEAAQEAALSATAAGEALEDIEEVIDEALEESGSIKIAIDAAVEAHALLTTGVHGLESE